MNNITERGSQYPEQQPLLELSRESREVLTIALEEAAKFGNKYIDTSGVLIGLSQIGELGEKLRALDVNPQTVRDIRDKIYKVQADTNIPVPKPTTAIEKWGQLPLTERMHKIALMVSRKATLERREIIEIEDILDVIIEERGGIAARVLQSMNIGKQAFLNNQ